MNGFSPRGSIVVFVCSEDMIHNPIYWPGVTSAVPGSNDLVMRDGEIFSDFTDGMTRQEMEEARWENDPEAEPGWARFERS